jgi:hypothetical protein
MKLPLKWHGGKYYLAAKIVRLTLRHLRYHEQNEISVVARCSEFDGNWLRNGS